MNKFKSLHIINRRAKYHNHSGIIDRMKALYNVKHRCINQWSDDFNKVEKHQINNKIYYCYFSDNWSFHIPKNKIIEDVNLQDEIKIISDIETKKYNDLDETEKDALLYLYTNHNINANNFISNNSDQYWYYLPQF